MDDTMVSAKTEIKKIITFQDYHEPKTLINHDLKTNVMEIEKNRLFETKSSYFKCRIYFTFIEPFYILLYYAYYRNFFSVIQISFM